MGNYCERARFQAVRWADRRLLAIAALAALAACALTVYVVGHPVNPEDVTLERDVQSVNWGPLALTFPVFSWIGDAKGAVVEAVIFVGVLVFNRRAWLVAAGCAVTAVLYIVVNHLVLRPRPSTGLVLHVTEHPPGSSFPSGHTMFVVTIVTVLMVCLGVPFLPRRVQLAGWILGAVLVVLNGISRVEVGAHWPSDVLAAVLIAVAWLGLWLSVTSRRLRHDVAAR